MDLLMNMLRLTGFIEVLVNGAPSKYLQFEIEGVFILPSFVVEI